jgi:hypothetical protein
MTCAAIRGVAEVATSGGAGAANKLVSGTSGEAASWAATWPPGGHQPVRGNRLVPTGSNQAPLPRKPKYLQQYCPNARVRDIVTYGCAPVIRHACWPIISTVPSISIPAGGLSREHVRIPCSCESRESPCMLFHPPLHNPLSDPYPCS